MTTDNRKKGYTPNSGLNASGRTVKNAPAAFSWIKGLGIKKIPQSYNSNALIDF